jgi:hypothetical protein
MEYGEARQHSSTTNRMKNVRTYLHAHMHLDSETAILVSLYLYMYSVSLPISQ